MQLFTFFIIFFCSLYLYSDEIKNYKVIHEYTNYKNRDIELIRKFSKNDEILYLAVDVEGLNTFLIKKDELYFHDSSKKNTRYQKLLNFVYKEPFLLHNKGIKTIKSNKVYLTVDLCPSSKHGYEKAFFQKLIKKYNKASLTIFVSAFWIEKHNEEFLELLSLQKKGVLNINWGNHTFHHPYSKHIPLEKNFLLMPHINIENELLDNEKYLLSKGVVPSILFRAPGLVSNQQVVNIAKKLGLIMIGSDTWLAKDEKIHKGSIILVHGNKNEPLGIIKANKELIGSSYSLGNILNDL